MEHSFILELLDERPPAKTGGLHPIGAHSSTQPLESGDLLSDEPVELVERELSLLERLAAHPVGQGELAGGGQVPCPCSRSPYPDSLLPDTY